MSMMRVLTRNLLANWIGYIANVVVAFCLAPYVVHSLGKAAYGVWMVLSSLTGYLGLVEMGTQAGLGRYVNHYLGRGEMDKVNGVLNSALAFFVLVGGALLLVAGGMAAAFPYLFPKVEASLVAVARPALVLVAVNLWMSFLAAALGQVLTAHERFDMQNGVNLSVLVVRAVGTVMVLRAGGGLVGLAAVQVASSVMGVATAWLLSRRVFAAMRLGLAHVSRQRLKELFGFGVWAFVGQIAMRLMYWTDEIVIISLLGPSPVTYYALALMLVQYGRGFVDSTAGVLGPRTIKAGSVKDFEQLQKILVWGSKVIMLVGTPLFVGLAFFGTEFFVLWMGEDFAVSGSVLILLALPQLFVMGVRPCVNIINGLGYVRFGAMITLAQGVMNLALSLVFVMVMGLGLHGVALGTLVPAVLFNCIVAAFVLRWIHYPGKKFLGNNVLRSLSGAGLFAGICCAIRLVPGLTGWGWFLGKVIAAVVLFAPIGWWVTFSREERKAFSERLAGLFRRAPRD